MRKKKAKWERKPAVLHPKSERDCRYCQEEKQKKRVAEREMLRAWVIRNARSG